MKLKNTSLTEIFAKAAIFTGLSMAFGIVPFTVVGGVSAMLGASIGTYIADEFAVPAMRKHVYPRFSKNKPK